MSTRGLGLAAAAALSFAVLAPVGVVHAQMAGDGGQRVMRLASAYQVVPNIVYRVASGDELKLDLYQPSGLRGPNPTVLFFHLGGWTQGTKEAGMMSLLPWMDMGFSVLNVEYRLTSAAFAPAAVEDARCALRWVYRNQKQYNLDVTKIVTTGQSAGGHLAMTTALLPASAGMDDTCPGDRNGGASNTVPNNIDEMKVAAIVDQYGVADVNELLKNPNMRSWALAWLGSVSNREELARLVSPTTYIKAGMPPVFSVHGDQDPTVPYVLKQKFHQALEKAGVQHELLTVSGGKHGGWNEADTVKVYAAVRAFLTKYALIPAEAKLTAVP
jgi:acetyl esterase/lipase